MHASLRSDARLDVEPEQRPGRASVMDAEKAEPKEGVSDDEAQQRGSSRDVEVSSLRPPPPPQRTPVRPGKGVKRKMQSPSTEHGKGDDAEKPGSAKKRRKSTSGTPFSRTGSPSTLLKPALTERQQMALLLQMTDPHKQPATPFPVEEPSPRSRLQRRNERGETPLHVACIKGDFNGAVSLINQGADVNAADHAGWTPLHEACNYGYPELVVVLLQRGARVNARGMDGDTPLHDATVNNHVQVAKILLENGADQSLANDQGATPADICKNAEISKFLAERSLATPGKRSTAKRLQKTKPIAQELKTPEPQTQRGRRRRLETTPLSSLKHDADAVFSDGEMSTQRSEMESPVLSRRDSKSLTSLAEASREPVQPNPKLKKSRGRFYSDISSSESESDYFELAGKMGGVGPRRKAKVILGGRLEQLSEDQEMGEEPSGGGGGEGDVVREGGSEGQRGEGDGWGRGSAVEEREGVGRRESGGEEGGTSAATTEESDSAVVRSPSSLKVTPPKSPPSLTAHALTSSQPPHSPPPLPTPLSESTDKLPKREQEVSKASSREREESPPSGPSPPRALDDASPPLPASPNLKRSLFSSSEEEEEKVPERRPSRGDSEVDVDTVSSSSSLNSPTAISPPAMAPLLVSGSPETAMVVSLPLSLVVLGGLRGGEEGGPEGMEREGTVDEDQQAKADESVPPPQPGASLSGTEGEDASEAEHSLKAPPASQPPPTTDSRHSKHSRKPQHVFSSGRKSSKELRRDGGSERSQLECGETMEADDRADEGVFSVSVGWSVLTSPPDRQVPEGGGRQTKLFVGGREVLPDSRESVAGGRQREETAILVPGEDEDGKMPEVKSTVISFPTSLPIVFSSQRGSPTPLTSTTKSPASLSSFSSSSMSVKETYVAAPSFKTKTLPYLLDSLKTPPSSPGLKKSSHLGPGAGAPPGSPYVAAGAKEAALQERVAIALPPKRRYIRGVYHSAVLQRRREKSGPAPAKPKLFDSFIMSGTGSRPTKPVTPTNPKSVRPPILSGMHKLFSDQESERVKTRASHRAEQERLLLSLEQELVRAHQRAAKNYRPPVSVCAVLLERLLPHSLPADTLSAPALTADNAESQVKPKDPSSPSMSSLDERLLSALVQDVWDKFFQLKLSLLSRQRHEAETLWLLQQDQWTRRLVNMDGFPPATIQDIPSSHLPMVTNI